VALAERLRPSQLIAVRLPVRRPLRPGRARAAPEAVPDVS
jgi:hypothetical protein